MGSFPLVSFQIQLDINQLVLLVPLTFVPATIGFPRSHTTILVTFSILYSQLSGRNPYNRKEHRGGVQGQYKLYPVTKTTLGVGSFSWLSDTCGGSYAQELICDQLRRKTWEKRFKFNFRKKVFRLLNPTIVFPGLPPPTPKKASCSIYTKILKIIFTVNIKLDHR